MQIARKIIRNRNFVLVLAMVLGLIAGSWASVLKEYMFYILAIVMAFSATGISAKAMAPFKTMVSPLVMGPFLNYIVFGTVVIGLSYWLMPTPKLFLGFVVIASTPPGVAVIPFSYILGGDLKYSIVGVFGGFLSSLFLAPAIIGLFSDVDGGIDPVQLFLVMVQLVLVPMLFSRFLLWRPIKPMVEKIRGRIVDWGFALIIFTAVGLNRQVFFSNFEVLMLVSLVLFLGTFGLGWAYRLFCRKLGMAAPMAISQNLLVTVKSSGFAVVTALTLFGKEAAVPSAVMAVFVLSYLLYLSVRKEFLDSRKKQKST